MIVVKYEDRQGVVTVAKRFPDTTEQVFREAVKVWVWAWMELYPRQWIEIDGAVVPGDCLTGFIHAFALDPLELERRDAKWCHFVKQHSRS